MAKAIETLFIELRGNVDKLQQDMSKATNVVTGASNKIIGITSKISTAIKIGFAGVGLVAINKMSDALFNLAEKGEQAGSIVEGFQRLGGSAAVIDQAKTATLGLVSSFDLMTTANRLLVAGIPNVNENFVKLADVGARLADSLGKDTKTSINDLTTALIKGSAQGLQKYGFQLEGIQGKANIVATALSQLTAVQGKLAPITDSVANAHAAYKNELNDLITNIGIQLNTNPALIQSIREMGLAVSQIDIAGLVTVLTFFAKVAVSTTSIIVDLTSSLINLGTTIATKVTDGFSKLTAFIRAFDILVLKNKPDVDEWTGSVGKMGKTTQETAVVGKVAWEQIAESIRNASFQSQESVKQMKTDAESLATQYQETYGSINELLEEGYQKNIDESREKTTDFASNAIGDFQTLGSSLSNIFGGGGGIFEIFDSFLGTINDVSNAINSVSSIIGLFSGAPALAPGGAVPGLGGLTDIPIVGDILGGVGDIFGGLFAKGGIVKSPTTIQANGGIGMMGESGPEAIMPLTTKGGKLGVISHGGGGAKVVYNIDARGASPGVEHLIMRALRDTEDRAVARSVNLMADSKRRGGVYGDAF